MGSLVTAHCDMCNKDYRYAFGTIADVVPFDIVLKLMVKEQKYLLDFEVYKEVLRKELAEDPQFKTLSYEQQDKVLETSFKQVDEFFPQEEKDMIKNNILWGGSVEIYPIVDLRIPEEQREVFNVPLVHLEFLRPEGTVKYDRKYNENVLYVQFTPDQTMLTCPKHVTISARKVKEDRI
ncbi:hypothetical protein [Mycoplasma sp. 21DD0573]|uniref:hypothetical protein n=1 Tax=unclassified Mycoplasma TaxID=2683645 RepID=UPI002B1E32EE|nr:hypothetical protein [Mycoplasma sp. 21DD0573]MEA4276358.1 hypothetical protein [Mycoplasma sp. 21DD0573]